MQNVASFVFSGIFINSPVQLTCCCGWSFGSDSICDDFKSILVGPKWINLIIDIHINKNIM